MKLLVNKREHLGKKIKELRKMNLVPGIVYGRHIDTPLPVSFDRIQLIKSLQQAWMSTPVELTGENIDFLVLFQNIQYHPVSDQVLHVDCLAVNKDEKVRAEVPVQLVWISPFEKNGVWRIQLLKDRLEVEALPMNLPHDISIDISTLTQDGQVVHISDIVLDGDVVFVEEESLAVISAIAFSEESDETEEANIIEEGETSE